MGINQARHEGAAAGVDHRRLRGSGNVLAEFVDLVSNDDEGGVIDELVGLAVKEARVLDDDWSGSGTGGLGGIENRLYEYQRDHRAEKHRESHCLKFRRFQLVSRPQRMSS